jgi:hypothetical protein
MGRICPDCASTSATRFGTRQRAHCVRTAILDGALGELGGVTVAFVARPLPAVPWAVLGLALLGCGTVDPGPEFQQADVVFDEHFFYCKVEPMMLQQKCGPGDPSKDTQGCHFNVTQMHLQNHDPVPCNGIVPTGPIPEEAGGNYAAASREMSTDPNRAALLLRPTAKAIHPRQIFPDNSPQADLIRQWATRYSSR